MVNTCDGKSAKREASNLQRAWYIRRRCYFSACYRKVPCGVLLPIDFTLVLNLEEWFGKKQTKPLYIFFFS